MGPLPDTLERDAHVDLTERNAEVWLRRVGLLVVAGLAAAALAGVFGQRASTSSAASSMATLAVTSPGALRSGLVYQSRFDVEAIRWLDTPTLVLDDGWFEGMTLNSMQPEAKEQSERNGRMSLVFPAVPAGSTLSVRLQWQVNATTVGRREQSVVLTDGGATLTSIDRDVVVYP